ncbi:hypothetical protein PVAND_000064 [Polypedilum vanderplanki]|uniref:Uncharacterized protein n=1 Tax=Polypedilum vanderplanki TaxID=319348 RepID=A0A9J6BJ73_POLVA|nr:hypothetical protein PVAND_000064 [Polypedilum vanderplanki]
MNIIQINSTQEVNENYLQAKTEISADNKTAFNFYIFIQKVNQLMFEVNLNTLNPKFTCKDSFDICSPGKAKNIFVRFYIPYALKSITPTPKCPIFGEYKWKVDVTKNFGEIYAFVPPFLKNFQGIIAHLNVFVYTVENGKKINLVIVNEFYKIKLKQTIPLVILEEGSYEKDVLFYVNLGEPQMIGAQQIQEAEAKAPEDLTEEDKMALLGRPKNGDIIRAQLRIKESKEFKIIN